VAFPRPSHNVIGSLSSFWHLRVPEYSDERIAELLDALSEDVRHLIPALAHSYLDDLPVRLLARGLRTFGDTLDRKRLFNWLAAAGRSHRVRRGRGRGRALRPAMARRPTRSLEGSVPGLVARACGPRTRWAASPAIL